jgi:hypothetical protein
MRCDSHLVATDWLVFAGPLRFALRSMIISVAGAVATIAMTSGCGSSAGSGGGPCHVSATSTYSCDQGLVCNSSHHLTCEEPRSNGLGATCSEDDNCQEGLWCNFRISPIVCDHAVGLGQACPSPAACAAGLVCSGAEVCIMAQDAGGDASPE